MSEVLQFVGDVEKDAHAVLSAITKRWVTPIQGVCAYAGEHGFQNLMYSIPYWLSLAFGELGEESAKAGPVDLGFKDFRENVELDELDEVDQATAWAGRIAVAWCNGDGDTVKALMEEVVFTPIRCLDYADAVLLGIIRNVEWTHET